MSHRAATLFTAFALAIVTAACSQSDAGITTAVKAKLAGDDTVRAYQIDVDTADRVVTLSGAVDTPAARDQAIQLARQTEGVRDVVDQLTVGPQPEATTGLDPGLDDRAGQTARDAGDAAREGGREAREEAGEVGRDARDQARDATIETQNVTTDAAITASVKSQLLADRSIAGLKIDVDTNDGVVALNGTVRSAAEAERAIELARKTRGVKSVTNNLRVAS